jgi:hypothetical protein
MGNTNSPEGPFVFAQYYQWFIGLGANYPATGPGSYGCQFAVPRDTETPYLYVRYKENNDFKGWNSIRVYKADKARALEDGNQTIFGNLTVKNNIDCDFDISPAMKAVPNSGNEYLCAQIGLATENSRYKYPICIAVNTFTGMHRCFTDNEPLIDNENPLKFKDDYVGRIVIASGKIATDTKTKDDDEWKIKYDKEGIEIEDAVFMVQLSRTKKDKRVVGVLGMASRFNSRPERLIVNSVGEGAVWCINSNGNFQNGDLITSSDYLGYGEKQDSEFITNYTVGKITMDCDFELDSSLYECKEIEGGLRIAFVACIYYAG